MKDMLKKFNTTETWIDVETLANLKGVSKRAIRLSFNSKNSNYETKIENGKGGHLYKIRLSSIEEDLQIKYIHEYYDTIATTNNIVELHEFKPKAEKIISFKQRELALAKYDLIKIWENYRLEQKQKGISKKVADREFLTTYNTGLLYSKSSVNQIYQTFGGNDCYPTLEEKAAMLLYLITKNHSFSDGNKRIAASCFLYFLNKNNMLYKNNLPIIDNGTLFALTLLIAESKPSEMEIMKQIVVSVLNKG